MISFLKEWGGNNMVSFITQTPKYILDKKFVSRNANRVLISMFIDYVLRGSKGCDIDGELYEHNFDQVSETDKFPVPTLVFMVFQDEKLDIYDVVTFLYLCYVADKNQTVKVKVKIDQIAKATGMSKTKVKNSIENLIQFDMDFIKIIEKDTYELPLLDQEMIDNFNDLLDEAAAAEERGDTFSVPENFVRNYREMGFSLIEYTVLMFIISKASENISTLEEIIKEILDNSVEEEHHISEFFIRSAIKKAEEKHVFKLIKNKDGFAQILFL